MSKPFEIEDEQTGGAAAATAAETAASLGGDATYPVDDSATGAGTDLNVIVDLMSEAGVDTIWLDLDGDLVPETSISVDGPFEVDTASDPYSYEYDYESDPWITYEALDMSNLQDISGESMNTLLPIDVSAGYPDPFVLHTADWTTCEHYDPMAVVSDWSVDGYSTYSDPWAVDGYDATWTDSGDWYDSSAYAPGYWDDSAYYDSSAAYLDTSMPIDTWDLPYDASTGYDTSSFSYDSYDPAGYSTWDPSAGDAAHDSFISTITEDYSTSSDHYSHWMDQYNQAEQLSWDAWNASVDASISGDGVAAYDYNQLSLDAGSYADQAWSYSSDYSTSDWSSTSTYDSHDSFIDYIQS